MQTAVSTVAPLDIIGSSDLATVYGCAEASEEVVKEAGDNPFCAFDSFVDFLGVVWLTGVLDGDALDEAAAEGNEGDD